MNTLINRGDFRPADPFTDPMDGILAEIALNVQLPPGLHGISGERYGSVCRYVDRDGSPLHGRVAALYPQGSMATDSTISNRGTDDEYDVDAICEIDGPEETPETLMDLLEASLAGYPKVRIVRQTRCITLYYADGMHIDVTPARRRAGPEKVSDIVHHKKDSGQTGRYVLTNPYGFAGWYRDRTPIDPTFALALNKRLYEGAGMAFAAADIEDVPPQTPLIIKNVATVALQLLKRHRNVAYANATGRIPPSVLLACHAGYAALAGMGLTDMLIRQARWTARAIEEAERRGGLLTVTNPALLVERFTDRWPESAAQQKTYAGLLNDLADGLETARRGMELEDLQDWLRGQFGERVVTRSVLAFNERMGHQVLAQEHGYTRSGGLFTPAAAAIIGASAGLAPVAARAHTQMGERR